VVEKNKAPLVCLEHAAHVLGIKNSELPNLLKVKYPAAELRGIQSSKKLSSPLSKIPLNYGGDGGGLRWPLIRRGVMIRSFPPHPNPLPPGERPFIPSAELGGILAHFDKGSLLNHK